MSTGDVQEQRAARKAARADAEDAQLVIDLEFVNSLEIEHGDENVVMLRVPYTDGLTACVAARAPKASEVKRYRARLKGKDPDTAAAAEEVARSCVIYPDKDMFDQIANLRAGIVPQLGAEALKLVVGRAESEGKE